MSQSGKIKKLTLSFCAQGDVKTGKAFTSGSVLKGAHVAVAVAETTIKKETHIFSNVIFAPPPSPSRGGWAGTSGLASRLQERKS